MTSVLFTCILRCWPLYFLPVSFGVDLCTLYLYPEVLASLLFTCILPTTVLFTCILRCWPPLDTVMRRPPVTSRRLFHQVMSGYGEPCSKNNPYFWTMYKFTTVLLCNVYQSIQYMTMRGVLFVNFHVRQGVRVHACFPMLLYLLSYVYMFIKCTNGAHISCTIPTEII